MKKFEYLKLYSTHESEFNKLGEQGWEMVTYLIQGGNGLAVFKREII